VPFEKQEDPATRLVGERRHVLENRCRHQSVYPDGMIRVVAKSVKPLFVAAAPPSADFIAKSRRGASSSSVDLRRGLQWGHCRTA
jgi:hypothetical protein